MKSIKSVAFSALLTLGAFSAITYTSCSKDDCEDVICSNGGTCVDGTCACPTGYEGTTCQTESRAKFARTTAWNATDNPPSGNPLTYTCIITNGAGSVQNVIIDNNFADNFFVNNVNATVSGNTITIPSQEPDNDDYFVQGQGTYSSGTISWQYTLTPPTGSPVTNNGTWQ